MQFSATLAEPRTSQTGSPDLDQPQMQRPRSRESRCSTIVSLVLMGSEALHCIITGDVHTIRLPIKSGTERLQHCLICISLLFERRLAF